MQEKPRNNYKSLLNFHERSQALERLAAVWASRPLKPPGGRGSFGETSAAGVDEELANA